MPEINWGLLNSDPMAEQARAYSYADKISQSAAQYQAGAKFAAGDQSGAAAALSGAGDIDGAIKIRQAQQAQQRTQEQDRQAVQQRQQTSAKAAHEYIAKALPVFKAVQAQHATDPDGGAAAIGQAFDQLAPEISQMTGHPPEAVAQLRQSFISDPQGTIQRIEAMLPVEYKTVGRNVVRQQGDTVKPVYEGERDAPAGYVRGPDGALVFEKGGPADPDVIKRNATERREVVINNPMPQSATNSLRPEIALRKEFDQQPDVKAFNDVANSYDIISDIAKAPVTAQNDMSLIFAYMKMLDPGSVVREGEYATAKNTTGIEGRILNAYNQARDGRLLNPSQRKEYTNTAKSIYQSRKRRYDQLSNQYRGYARDAGLSEQTIVPRMEAGGGAAPANAGKPPKGVDQTLWNHMTPQERALWQTPSR